MDAWLEVIEVLSRHRLRTALTALSVAWGIFMLILLLAAGEGLRKGAEQDFRDDATNSIWLRGGRSSLPYGGLPPGREVRFTNRDLQTITQKVDGVEHWSGRYYLWGDIHVARDDQRARFDIRGCHPGHQFIEKTLIVEGRFINQLDIEQRRKVAVISPQVIQALFKPHEPVIGAYIEVRKVPYRVVGVYTDEGSRGELQKIYIPITTAQLVYHGGENIHHMMFTIDESTVEGSERIADETRQLIAARHRFDPTDARALYLSNNLKQFRKVMQVFDWVRWFVWVVGLGTVLAGVVGVSNIMLISVQERIVEIGVRKALGASPASVVSMIVREALLLTLLSGYVGLVLGAAVVELAKRYIGEGNPYLRDPEVELGAALVATAVLVVAGLLSGLVPAWRAARVKPIVAMRAST